MSRRFINNRFVRGLTKIYLKYFPVYFNGFWYYLNEGNYGLVPQIVGGNFESNNFQTIKSYLKDGDHVVDVGAHVGLYSLYFSKLVGEEGKVYSFEPEINNFKLLLKNIKLNHLNNIYPKKIAISDRKGVGKLYLSQKSNWDHRLFNPKDEKRNIVNVKKNKLDNIFHNKRIDFVKIDVQGLEEKCLDGMSNLIIESRNLVLFIEFWPNGLREAGSKPEKFIKKIKSFGFKIYRVEEDSVGLISLKNFKKLLNLPGYDHVNLLCIKNSFYQNEKNS